MFTTSHIPALLRISVPYAALRSRALHFSVEQVTAIPITGGSKDPQSIQLSSCLFANFKLLLKV
jgi:hypothetical protein